MTPDVIKGLQALRPAAVPLDRDALFYAAGRASAPPVWPWKWAAGALALSQLALAAAWLLTPPTVVEVVREVPAAPASTPVVPPSPPAEPELAAATPAQEPGARPDLWAALLDAALLDAALPLPPRVAPPRREPALSVHSDPRFTRFD